MSRENFQLSLLALSGCAKLVIKLKNFDKYLEDQPVQAHNISHGVSNLNLFSTESVLVRGPQDCQPKGRAFLLLNQILIQLQREEHQEEHPSPLSLEAGWRRSTSAIQALTKLKTARAQLRELEVKCKRQ